MNLRDIAFDEHYFEENEFKQKYLSLLEHALSNSYELGEFPESHHIIPRAVFKLLGKEDYDSKSMQAEVNKNNLVKLSIRDHILAHYYLALFSINELKKSACYSFLAMLDRDTAKLLPSEAEFFKLLPELEQIRIERSRLAREQRIGKKPWNYGLTKETSSIVAQYTENSKATKRTRNIDKKAGLERRGKIWVSKDGINKLITKDELDSYLATGWLNEFYISEAGMAAKIIANATNIGSTGKIWINNALENKMVDEYELAQFLANGWQRGRKPDNIDLTIKKKNDEAHAKRMQNKKHIHNKLTGECIRVDVSHVEEYLSSGWSLGNPKIAENNRNRKTNLKGKIYINNGIKNRLINEDDLDAYLNTGWLRGKKKRKA